MNINDSIFDYYRDAADWLIDNNNIGQTFTIYYPPIKVPCTNDHGLVGMSQNNTGEFGGPATTTCEYCNGDNVIDQVTSTTLKMRIYWERKAWIKVGNINFPDADAMIIGYLTDLPKLESAAEIVLQNNANRWGFVLACKPFPHGFGKNRYFIGYVKQNT